MAVRHAGLRIVGTLSTRRSGPQPATLECSPDSNLPDVGVVIAICVHRSRRLSEIIIGNPRICCP